MERRGQLEFIEMKYFFMGLLIGLLGGLILVKLGIIGTLPFKVPLVCG